MKNKISVLTAVACLAVIQSVIADGLKQDFLTPPDAARPGVYWYFMDGNQDRNEMLADLRAMKKVGLGSVIFLEVDLHMPRGPVAFMSETWQDNVARAFVEAGKLGMEVILGTGPGWAGSGGSWVGIDDSMQHLVGGSVRVSGPVRFDQALPVPPPHPPNHFSGMSRAHKEQRGQWLRDVAVLAYPTPPGGVVGIKDAEIKTLRDIKPYSIRMTDTRFITPQAIYTEPDAARVIDASRTVDLTELLQPDGRLAWDVPAGDWTIMRFVARSTGQTTRPAPRTGHGFEHDKFSAASYQRHWDHYQKKLLERTIALGGPLRPGKGLTTVHLDSWEMSSQNWTAGFRGEFRKRRGYDPQPFYPAWMGMVVGSLEQTERFLWDMRKTSQELVIEEYAGAIKQVAREHGLLYSNEPYDMNPAGDLDLGSVADIPMCEFWNAPHDTQYGCIEAAGIAHTMGRPIVRAEAFTSSQEAFAENPANMKNRTDWAFAIGINGIMFHTYQHQALGDAEKPGMTMGPYGIQWHRNQTFWDFLAPYHEYITRCSHLLRQGEAVADILYLTPEGAPHIFEAPADALEGDARMRDKKGYSFDAVSPRILAMRATVENGRIAFPGGSKYRVLVLPDVPTMTPGTLACIDRLLRAGATIIGNPPHKSPSLVDYPACDKTVVKQAAEIWGQPQPPSTVSRIACGKGAVYWGRGLDPANGIYPKHSATAALLKQLALAEDFSSPSGKLRFIHRQTADRDIYFVSNRTEERVVTEGVFRIDGLRPELWDPLSGETRALGLYHNSGGLTRVPLSFEPLQSFFVIFPHDSAASPTASSPTGNFPALTQIMELGGAWDVAFNPALGGPAAVTFDPLVDWTQRPESGIRYYSGIATYRKTFDLSEFDPAAGRRLYLDLGKLHSIGRVRLNGRETGTVWTSPWRVDITAAARSKGNVLEIEVANNWVNRLIGDQQPADNNARTLSWPSGLLEGKNNPAGRFTFVTRTHYKATSPLKPAGLLGPVSLLTASP
jgi:hypothetical protein